MKKALILLLALGFVASYAFAEDGKVEFSVSGSAALSVGYNLDTGDFGFLNESSSDLVVTLVNAADKTKGTDADGATYATITLSGLKVSFSKLVGVITASPGVADVASATSGYYWVDLNGDGNWDSGENLGIQSALVTAPGVSAKIMMKPLFITIFGAPGMGLDLAAPIKNATDVKGDFAFGSGTDYGTDIGVTTDSISADAYIVSDSDWKGTTSLWATGINATLKFAPATVTLGARIPFDGSMLSFAAKAALALDPISFDAAFDGLSAGATFSWDTRVNASVKFMTASSFGLGFYMNSGTGGELSATAALGAADAGGFSVSVSGYLVNTFANFFVEASLGYTTGNITVAATAKYNSDNNGGYSANSFWATLGVTVAKIVPNADLSLTWTSNDLSLATGGLGTIVAKVSVAF